MNIAVIGAGSFGMALSYALTKSRDTSFINNVVVFSRRQSFVSSFKSSSNLSVSNNIESVVTFAEIIFVVIPCQSIKSFLSRISYLSLNKKTFVLCSKGLNDPSGNDESYFFSDVIQEYFPDSKIVIFSGAGYADEIISNIPTTITLSSKHHECKHIVANLFNNTNLSFDFKANILESQLLSSFKNVIAIILGFKNGTLDEAVKVLNLNNDVYPFYNVLAKEFLSIINELQILLKSFDCKEEAILSSAGIGDILLSSIGQKSRNNKFGYIIGSKLTNYIIKYKQNYSNDMLYSDNFPFNVLLKEDMATISEEIRKKLNTNLTEGSRSIKLFIKIAKDKNIELRKVFIMNKILDILILN